jgi:hypothetical protein
MKEIVEKTIKQKVVKAHTVAVEKVYCDLCILEKKKKKVVAVNKCTLCNRDICNYWTSGSKGHTYADERDYGDYPSKYCAICHDLKFTGAYEEEYRVLDSEFDKALEALDRKIKKESLTYNG